MATKSTPKSTRVEISHVEAQKNTLDTPFKRRGSAAVLAYDTEGQLFLYRMRVTNYDYLAKLVTHVAEAGSINPEFWAQVDPILWEELAALKGLDGTTYAQGRMAVVEVNEDPLAPTPDASSGLPHSERTPNRMGYTL